MRDKDTAPVDTMGVEFTIDESVDKSISKFQTLVSLMLSAQTKDPVTFAAMKRLIDYGLTIDKIVEISEEKLIELIYGVNFHNTKAKNILNLAKVLKEKYNSDPPETYSEITSFKGIGPKMCHLYLQCCCNKVEGIAVDVHVHRISNRLNWTKSKNAEETRKQLEGWLPVEHWVDINFVLVGFGQLICEAKKPKCDGCMIKDSCPYYKNEIKDKEIVSKKKSKSVSKNNIKRITEEEDFEQIKNKKNLNSKKLKENEEYFNTLERFNEDDLDNKEFLSFNNIKSIKYTSKSKNRMIKVVSKNKEEIEKNINSEKLIKKTLPNKRESIPVMNEEIETKYKKRKKN